ncbi:sensor histidine kinase [Kiloniella majae]|uniref:sensor histidine kinase n=1 Tax=Kiloniella majae TaxID=1938558 RepID=UPI000F77AC7C|nr:HAMP domain-containing sensor histidine kinase [Kiloniella majae]
MPALSIRDVLYRRLSIYLAAGWIIATVLIGFASSQYFNEAQRGQITHLAYRILAFESAYNKTESSIKTTYNQLTKTTSDIGITDYFIVIIKNGQIHYTTINLPDNELLALPMEGKLTYQAKNQLTIWGAIDDDWTLYSVVDQKQNIRVIIGSWQGEVSLGILTITSFVFSVGLIVGVISLLVARRTVKQVVEPMEHAATIVRARKHNHLSPIELGSDLYEIKEIEDALNNLIARMDQTIRREQNFIANAAHELRTPLTAIRTQAEAINPKTIPEEVKKQINGMLVATERATRLISQLLQLARSESIALGTDENEPTDLVDFTRMVISDFVPQIYEDGGEIELISPDSLNLTINRALIHSLLGNLIENAVKYAGKDMCEYSEKDREKNTSAFKSISVELGHTEQGQVFISVEDNGNGMSKSDFKASFAKFDRLGKKSGSGAGLGLSIVKQITQRQNLILDQQPATRLGGHKVIVIFNSPH